MSPSKSPVTTGPSFPLPSIEELRVAQQELSYISKRKGKDHNKNPSNDDSRGVYVQLSKGSVAFLTERSVAQARVSRQLQQAVQVEDQPPP